MHLIMFCQTDKYHRHISINPFTNNPCLSRSCRRKLLKTFRVKDKMLVTSIFSFSHNVFFPIKSRNDHLRNILCVVRNAFNLDRAKILSFGHTCHNFFRQIRDNGLHFPGFASIFRDRHTPPPPHFFFFQS